MAKEATIDRLAGWREAMRHDLDSLETFVMFAGYPRSGHTLVGSLLSAHPDAIVAHELNALRYVRRGLDRRALFGLLLRRDREFAEGGSVWGYDYSVPEQWQGRYRSLRVIGDKKGGGTSLLLQRDPDLLDRLQRTVRLPVKVVIVTRHPLDNIARISLSDGESIDRAAEAYFARADALELLIGKADCFIMKHEEFVRDTRGQMRSLLRWLALEEDEGYVRACSGVVNESPRLARDKVNFSVSTLTSLRAEAASRSLLADYTDWSLRDDSWGV